MSTDIAELNNTGKDDNLLQFTQFSNEKGLLLQLTQGFGGASAMKQLDTDEPGYITLSMRDAYETIGILTNWIKEVSHAKAEALTVQIEADSRLRKTIFSDAVECERFIADLKILDVPISLLR